MGADDLAVVAVTDGAAIVRRVAREALLPERDLKLSEWSEEFRLLTSKTASEPGPWRNARTPYLVEIMDCLSTGNPAEEVVFMKGTQVGATECGNNWIGYVIHQAPAPMMHIQPTLNLAKRFSKHRLSTMIDAMAVLRTRIGEKRSRDTANTTLMKDFPGGLLVIAGANSATDLRSMPCKYIFADEIDGYPFDVDGEGDPLALADKRATNFPRRKKFKCSTPTTKGFSRIEQAMEQSDFRRYHVPCPHCGELQPLKWANLRWTSEPDHDPDTAHYVCEKHGCVIEERYKAQMLSGGRWVADFPGRGDGRIVGFHLSTLYSPLGWESWASLVRQFLEAKRAQKAGDDTKMKTFVNTCLGESWEEEGDKIKVGELQDRAERYDLGTVPFGGLILTMAVDVQGNRLEWKTKAWGILEESWVVDYGTIAGDPAKVEVWAELRKVIMTPLEHESGHVLAVQCVAIDSGGHHTHEVYQFCRASRNLVPYGVFAVKGHAQRNKPIIGKPSVVDINRRGDKIPRGAQLWMLGTDTAKGLILGRMKIEGPGPGYMHFSDQLPADYYLQLTAERQVTRYVRGRPKLEWIKPAGIRNEALDLEVYNVAAAQKMGMNRWKLPRWEQEAARLTPKPAIPKEIAAEVAVAVQQRPIRPSGGGFVTRWRK